MWNFLRIWRKKCEEGVCDPIHVVFGDFPDFDGLLGLKSGYVSIANMLIHALKSKWMEKTDLLTCMCFLYRVRKILQFQIKLNFFGQH